jgi:hypothetical protein
MHQYFTEVKVLIFIMLVLQVYGICVRASKHPVRSSLDLLLLIWVLFRTCCWMIIVCIIRFKNDDDDAIHMLKSYP